MKSNPFKKFVNESLSKADAKSLKDQVLRECAKTEKTWYNWLNDPGTIEKPYKKIIARIARKRISTLFPQSPLTKKPQYSN